MGELLVVVHRPQPLQKFLDKTTLEKKFAFVGNDDCRRALDALAAGNDTNKASAWNPGMFVLVDVLLHHRFVLSPVDHIDLEIRLGRIVRDAGRQSANAVVDFLYEAMDRLCPVARGQVMDVEQDRGGELLDQIGTPARAAVLEPEDGLLDPLQQLFS